MAIWAMLNARDCFAGAGVYRMTPAQLARYRGAVAGGGVAALEAAVAASGLELGGDGTRGAPRGYPKDHPRLDLLRRKALTLGARIPAPEAVADAARARAHAMAAWEKTRAASLWMDAEVGACLAAARRRPSPLVVAPPPRPFRSSPADAASL